MAVQKGLYAKSVFFILYGFAIVNQGISQDSEDYSANVEIVELTAKPNNGYFQVEGDLPKVIFYTTQEIKSSLKVYVVDYYFDKSGQKKKIASKLLCEELPKKDNSDLRNRILSTFLFPRQQRCPAKQDKVREPASKMLSFNYDSSEVSCDSWKYRQELISVYNKEPLAAITVNLKMEKKNECAS